jgi:hypothetical protein
VMLGFWRRHWWADVLLGLAAVLMLWHFLDRGLLHGGDAGSLFVVVSTASAALGTLAITPIAIVLALTPGPRLRALLDHQVAVVRRAMVWTVFANLLTVAIGVVGISTDDRVHVEVPVRVLALTFEASSLLAMARLVWFFAALLRLDDVDKAAETR